MHNRRIRREAKMDTVTGKPPPAGPEPLKSVRKHAAKGENVVTYRLN